MTREEHYRDALERRFRRWDVTASAVQRFRSFCSAPDENGCIRWLGAINSCGYGSFHANAEVRGVRAHRFAYSIDHALLDMPLDHLCRNRWCVNAEHLEHVTSRENTHRGLNCPKTHCKHGHSFSGENVILRYRGGRGPYRECRECTRAKGRRRYHRMRDAGTWTHTPRKKSTA